MGNYSYFRKQLRGKNVFSAKGNIFVIYSDILGVARCCRNYPFVLFSWSLLNQQDLKLVVVINSRYMFQIRIYANIKSMMYGTATSYYLEMFSYKLHDGGINMGPG